MTHRRISPFRASASALFALIACICACTKADAPTPDVGNDTSYTADVDVIEDAAPDASDAADAAPSPTEGCNPLAPPGECMLPYPSDYFLVDRVVELGAAAPRDKYDAQIDPIAQLPRPLDGFALLPSILFDLGQTLDPDPLVAWDAPEVSITPQSATILLHADTLEPVPHFSELYTGTGPDVQHRLGAIRPLVRLAEGQRYIAAVQNLTADGAAVAPTAGFAELLAGGGDPRYEADIFAPLAEFGVERTNLQLAWDFTTRSEDNVSGDMFAVRDGTLAWLAANEPTVTIHDVFEGDDLNAALVGTTARHIEGSFTAPQWVVANEPGTTLAGAPGAREIVGTIEVPFSVTIPTSIADGTLPAGPFVQFGHGFFGGRTEVVSQVQSEFGDLAGVVMGAVDWQGMTLADRNWLVGKLSSETESAFAFAPRVHQAMVNQLVFTHVARELLAEQPALQIDGAPTFDAARVHFLGISQGHILGGTFAALTPSIDRVVLHAGGASLGYTLTRSFAFVLFELILAQKFEARELLKFEALAAAALEPIDPITYAPYVLTAPLPDAAPRRVLMQGGIGDTAVPTTSLELHARALGVPLITPTAARVPFLPEVAGPVESGLTLVDFGVDQTATRTWSPVTNDAPIHEDVRRMAEIRAQMRRFLVDDGLVENPCDGPCVVAD